MSKRRYEMPLGTKVEIMTEGFLGRKFNGKIGKSGAKDPGGTGCPYGLFQQWRV